MRHFRELVAIALVIVVVTIVVAVVVEVRRRRGVSRAQETARRAEQAEIALAGGMA
jgi:heme exporter protein D